MGPRETAYEAQSNTTESFYRPNFSQAHGSIPPLISDAVVSEMPPPALRLPAPCRHGGVRDVLPLLAFLLLPALPLTSAAYRSAPFGTALHFPDRCLRSPAAQN
jgi:hypothetical protein